jgi:hypothetical protein
MSHLDDAIRETLSAEDADLLERFGADLPIHRQLLQTLRGPYGGLNVFAVLLGMALFAVWAFCAWRFVETTEVRGMLLWGAASGIGFIGLCFVKLWFWMELQKNAVVREVKRLGLQLARLSARTDAASS